MNSDSRLLSLLGMFAAGRTYSASELAAHFGVTARTIRRDISDLRALGYVIDSVPGVAGGYRAESRTLLPPLQLETGEALATAVGLALLNGAGLSTSNADSATGKLQGMLPPTMRETVGDISAAVSVLPGHAPGVDLTAVIAIASAITSHYVVTFGYGKGTLGGSGSGSGSGSDNGNGNGGSGGSGGNSGQGRNGGSGSAQPQGRRVEPIRLVVLGAHWYLYAWDLDRTDWRVFRIDRMSDVHATTFAFTPRTHPDAEAAVSSAVTTAAYRHTVVLHAAASVDDAKSWFPTRTATITEAAGGVRIEFGVEDLRWAAVVTAGTPVDFRVIEPPELLIELKHLAERATRASTTGSVAAEHKPD